MKKIKQVLLLALISSLIYPPGVLASTTTSFVPVMTGYFDDPNLPGFTTYAYRVDATTDWTISDLDVYLTSGSLNHIDPTFLNSSSSVNGFGDTANFAPTTVPGDLSAGITGDAAQHDFYESSNRFRTTWGNTNSNDIGTFDIAMITLSHDANGSLAYRTISGANVEDGPAIALRPDLHIVNGQILSFDGTLPDLHPAIPTDPGTGDPGELPLAYETSFIPISNGVFDDPSLPGYTTYAYRVKAPTDWTNSDLSINLTSGTLNHIQPAFLGSTANVNGLGDSAVFAPLNQVGDLTSGFSGAVGFAGNQSETPTSLNNSWFTIDNDNIGEFDIAMLTLSDDASGTLRYRTIYGTVVDDGGIANDSYLTIQNGQIIRTEPYNPPTYTPPNNDPPNNDPPNNDPPNNDSPVDHTPPTPYGSESTETTFVAVDSGNFDDPNLEGFTTFAMRVTATDDWTSADLHVELTSGTIHHAPPSFLGSPNVVSSFGDSAGMAPTNVTGDLTEGFNGTVGFTGTHVETPTELLTSWFTNETNDVGTFDIAILTLSDDANGIIRFRTVAGSVEEDGGFGGTGGGFIIENGRIVNIFLIPEPATIAILFAGIALGMMQRRRD